MAISIDRLTSIIFVPKADLTLVSGTIHTFDTDQFRLNLKALEAAAPGIVFLKTHNHNTEITIVGTTYARFLEILAPYSVEFEDGQYTVILQGSNNNVFDVAGGILVQNQVQIVASNAAGLVVTGSGVTNQDKTDIIEGVWENVIDSGLTAEEILRLLICVAAGKTSIADLGGGLATVIFRDIADSKDRVTAAMDGSERTSVTLDET